MEPGELSSTHGRRLSLAGLLARSREFHQAMPKLVLIGGYPGVGKTTLGRALAQRLHYAHIDQDVATQLMTEGMLTALQCDFADRESSSYARQVKPLEYATTLRLAFDNLAVGNSVICTAPYTCQFRDARWVEQIGIQAQSHGADLNLVLVTADPAIRYQRLVQRGAPRDRQKIAHWEAYIATLPQDLPFHPDLLLVSSPSSDDVSDVVRHLYRGDPSLVLK